jgi:hypothetical protein
MKSTFDFPLGGGSIGVGLLGENHHNINLIGMGEGLLLNEGVVDHFLHCLVEQLDPRLAIVVAKVGTLPKELLHSSHTAMNGQNVAMCTYCNI